MKCTMLNAIAPRHTLGALFYGKLGRSETKIMTPASPADTKNFIHILVLVAPLSYVRIKNNKQLPE